MDSTNNNAERTKTAIVVIHGMGNQYPMETITDFVDNLFKIEKKDDKDDNETKIYSASERITGSFDQRKLIILNNVQYDCYEYYWAHLIKEPSVSDTISWMYNLIWKKESSDRLRSYIPYLKVITLLLPVLFILVFYLYYLILLSTLYWLPIWLHVFVFLIPLVLYYGVRYLTRLLTQSFGDVIRYTVPHPSNLEGRQKIANNAVQFLTSLHDKDYSRIVIVGHSLGAIIAYEMLINTFGNMNNSFEKGKGLDNRDNIREQTKEESLKEMQDLGWNWKVTDFITCGSPLCHAEMILTKNKALFERKKELGEYPVNPPKRKGKDLFYLNNRTNKYVPTHDSVFRYVEWNNIHFKNDIIGGNLSPLFGPDIIDHKAIDPKKYKIILQSHTHYWNRTQEEESFKIIEKIIKK